MYVYYFRYDGLDGTVVSISHCGFNDPDLIPGLVTTFSRITHLPWSLEYAYKVENALICTTIQLIRCPQGLTTGTFPYKNKPKHAFQYISTFFQ